MSTDAADWQDLQRLFHLIDAAPESEREALLTAACADPALRRRVWSIHRASLQGMASGPPSGPQSGPGERRIGPYRLVRHLGSGGMGAVYAAERELDGVVQRSALKVLAPHAVGPLLAGRFQRERRILASLEHPAITRLLDAGVDEEGQGYLSMEYVDGAHLDDYCDRHVLGIPERVGLLLKVCEAVEYAHRNLVVHLDLKPSNILVTAEAAVKLLDFGTAKLMDTDGGTTFTLIATPNYASPEQLRGEPVTTACDVYSLGVILFELLCGRKPFGDASMAGSIERAVAELEPPAVRDAVTDRAAAARGTSVGRLRAQLTGDLTTIVRKCLAARPGDRYPSVGALAEDLRRHLQARPVLAQRQTALYHVQKFVRRHRLAVLTSGLVFAVLVASLGYAWHGELKAVREGQRALRMQTFLYRLFEIANSNYTGKPAASIREFLALGVKTLPEYVRDPQDLRHAQLALAQSMYWNHDYDDALPIYTQIAGDASTEGDVAAEAEADAYLGYLALRRGATEEARARSARALELSAQRIVPPEVRVLSELNYAMVREQTGFHAEENFELLSSAVALAREAHLPAHEIGSLLYFWGSMVLAQGGIDEAERHYQDALAAYRQDPLSVCDEISVQAGLANVMSYRNRFVDSEPLFRLAYERSKTCNGPEDTQTLRFLTSWANALVKSGRAPDTIRLLEEALPAWQARIPRSSPFTMEMLQPLGRAYVESGRFTDAQRIAGEMQDALEQAKFAANHKYFGYAQLLMAQALAGQGLYRDALPHAAAAYGNLSAFENTPAGRLNSERARQLLAEMRAKTAP